VNRPSCRVILVAIALMTAPVRYGADKQGTPVSSRYIYEGQLGYRSANNDLIPITDARFFLGHGPGACQPSLQSEIDVDVQADGRFSLDVTPSEIAIRSAPFNPGSQDAEVTCDVIVEWPCYRVKARGCRDQSLQFDGTTRPKQQITMDCPGRRVQP